MINLKEETIKNLEEHGKKPEDIKWAGFDGFGGQAMTTANTCVLIPESCHQDCFVYFAGRFAYKVPYSETFGEDVRNHSMKSVNQSRLYIKEANSNNE